MIRAPTTWNPYRIARSTISCLAGMSTSSMAGSPHHRRGSGTRCSAGREDFLEEIRGAGGGIRADEALLLAHDVKKPVERLPDHVVVQIEGVSLGERDRFEAADQIVILASYANLVQSLLDGRLEGGRELVGGLVLEEVRGRGVAAAQDLLRVVEAHAL